jgi:hypothetical protein
MSDFNGNTDLPDQNLDFDSLDIDDQDGALDLDYNSGSEAVEDLPQDTEQDSIENSTDEDDTEEESEEVEEDVEESPYVDTIHEVLDSLDLFDLDNIEDSEGNVVSYSDLKEEDKAILFKNAMDSYRDRVSDALSMSEEDQEILDKIKQRGGLEGYEKSIIDQNTIINYQVDDVPTDDLWLTHWASQYKAEIESGKLTEEQLANTLENKKNDPTFDIDTENLRQTYRDAQDRGRKELEDTKLQEQEEHDNSIREAYRNNVIEAALSDDMLLGFKIEDDFRDDVLGDLVEYDEYGTNNFIREILNDPSKMWKAAAFLKHGEAMFEEMENSYKNEIGELKKTRAASTKQTKKKTNSVITETSKSKTKMSPPIPNGNTLQAGDEIDFDIV